MAGGTHFSGPLTVAGVEVVNSSGAITADIQATAGSIGTTELADDVLSADAAGRAKIATGFFDTTTASDAFAASSIGPNLIGTQGEGDSQRGVMRVASVDSTTAKALLDGNPNTLNLNLPAGAMIIDFAVYTQTAAGSAGTVKVGTDSNWNIGADDDAFIAAHDLNAQGAYLMSREDETGAVAAIDGVFASAEADLTIQSSADLSASSWAGGIKVFYVE